MINALPLAHPIREPISLLGLNHATSAKQHRDSEAKWGQCRAFSRSRIVAKNIPPGRFLWGIAQNHQALKAGSNPVRVALISYATCQGLANGVAASPKTIVS